MRKKEKALVVTFNTTVAAMEAENYFQEHDLPGRIIPVPPAVKAGCGLAWMSPPDMKEKMVQELKDAGIQWHDMHVMEV